MKYREFGNLGFKVSELSFGASALGGVFRTVDEEAAVRAVHAALDAGINYIDVAPAYGATRSETVLGKALKDVPRSQYRISTKVGKLSASGESRKQFFDYTKQGIVKSLDDSSRRVGVDYFDIIHIHDIEYGGRVNVEHALSEGYQTLLELKERGRIGGVSFGIYPMDLWHRIVSEFPIDAMLVHNHHCLNDTRALELLPAVKDKKIALVNASPFGSGILSGREPPDWHPATEDDLVCVRKAIEFCNAQNVPIAKLALQFSASNPEIPTTMFSSASEQSVSRNIRWLEEPYEDDLITRVREILSPIADKEWDYDSGLEN